MGSLKVRRRSRLVRGSPTKADNDPSFTNAGMHEEEANCDMLDENWCLTCLQSYLNSKFASVIVRRVTKTSKHAINCRSVSRKVTTEIMIMELLKSLKRHKSLIVIELFSWCELGPRGMISLHPARPLTRNNFWLHYTLYKRWFNVIIGPCSAFEAK